MNFIETPALAIYAQVQRDYLPVLGADVTAIISFSDTSTTSMTLLDNGSGEPNASYRFDATNAVFVRHALEASALVVRWLSVKFIDYRYRPDTSAIFGTGLPYDLLNDIRVGAPGKNFRKGCGGGVVLEPQNKK